MSCPITYLQIFQISTMRAAWPDSISPNFIKEDEIA
jgi:hypothetical protein